ncbi:ORF124 protein [Operophtera brumata nucleopolyhedrovirus]|uniref:ORF124 protein n=1 Tax=Operophtera brumata nucleopolyhedrovirus TaxID=1046267 RepID=A0A2H4V016_9ABAC|nr:ORF124 protein [Operophtera brumata nucleopolyhedrovirus]AUA60355.1 ORF124 protein [Operophtera brumata nucleopolyhedrovirus]
MEERIENIKTKSLAIRTDFMKKAKLLISDENKALEVEYLSILENSLDTQVEFLEKTNLPVTAEYILAFQLNENTESLMSMSLDYFKLPFYAKLYETTQKRYRALNKQLTQQINVLKKHIVEGKEIKQTFLDEVFYLQSNLVKCLEQANFYIRRNT